MGFSNWLARIISRFFPRITKYSLTPGVRRTMHAMSVETHPKEAFGVLIGRHEGNLLVVERAVYQPFVNTERSATVMIDPSLTGVVGTFHSHPGGDARTSAADTRLFRRYPGVHCIVPEPYNTAHVYNHHSVLLNVEELSSRFTKTKSSS